MACQLVVEAGADYVKTSTGFGAAGATVEDVSLMKEAVAGRAKVKASGGIRDWKTTLAMLEAGADRIGTSASLAIMAEWQLQRPACLHSPQYSKARRIVEFRTLQCFNLETAWNRQLSRTSRLSHPPSNSEPRHSALRIRACRAPLRHIRCVSLLL